MTKTTHNKNRNEMFTSQDCCWSFRPSAIQKLNYDKLSEDELTQHYIQDNEHAFKVYQHQQHKQKQKQSFDSLTCIPVHPQKQQEEYHSSSYYHPPLKYLRTLQWNIQAWRSPLGERSAENTIGIINAILETQTDVLILNEYHWKDPTHCIHRHFESLLKEEYGYQHVFLGQNGYTPSLIASKFPVLEYHEIVLSYERSALCMKMQIIDYGGNNDETDTVSTQEVWVIGTHLDAFDGIQRQKEIQYLLRCFQTYDIFQNSKGIPMIIMGDFNQQRQQDYTVEEWKHIASSMKRRNVCHDDAVSQVLQSHGFDCVFDTIRTAGTGTVVVQPKCNWDPSTLPPSTHWTGTTIDYSYFNKNGLQIDGVYISPVGFSDHRMTVCDWNIEQCPYTSDNNNKNDTTSTTTTMTTTCTATNIVTGGKSLTTTTATATSTAAKTMTALIVDEEVDHEHNIVVMDDGSSSSSSF